MSAFIPSFQNMKELAKMLQEKEILFDEPDDLANNFEYISNLNPTLKSVRDNSELINKSKVLHLKHQNHQDNKPTTSSSLDQSKQDLILAQRLQEAEKVYLA